VRESKRCHAGIHAKTEVRETATAEACRSQPQRSNDHAVGKSPRSGDNRRRQTVCVATASIAALLVLDKESPGKSNAKAVRYKTMLDGIGFSVRSGVKHILNCTYGTRATAVANGAQSALLVVGVLAFAGYVPAAWSASDEDASKDPVLAEVIVTAAKNLVGVIQESDSAIALGIDKPLVDTPRSVTAISDQLLDRYNVKTVYDFTAVAAGTYTGSYFGVPGSLNIRGTMADTYFMGFQQITNFATYPTPVDASSNIELVRGPTSPAYGAGQIGGYLNFIPKSALGGDAQYLAEPTGAMSLTYGSYNQKEGTLQAATPFMLGSHQAGVSAFVEVVDSDSFYIGEHPRSQTAQLTFNAELASNWSLSATAQVIHSEGYLKDIGWNRVTQNLIDNGEYLSGTALTPIVQPGQRYITVADYLAANAKAPGGIQQYVLPAFGVFATPNQYIALNAATVRLVELSPRQTEISADDINNATTPLLYVGVTRTFSDYGTLKLESFSQYLDALNYQSSGFATLFRTTINEERITYNDRRNFGDDVFLQSAVGLSYRYTHALSYQYLNSGVNSQDRWDLSKPQTSDEIFNAVFDAPGIGGYDWDNATVSHQSDIGIFAIEDALLFEHLDITAGVRNDNYSLRSADNGPYASINGVNQYQWYAQNASPVGYNFSVSFKNPYVVPYYTYAKSYSLNIDQGDAIIPSLIAGDSAIGGSTLYEAGLKTSQLHGRLFAAVDVYRQRNQYLDARDAGIDSQESKGLEGELRYLITKHLGFTSAITFQHVRQLAEGNGNGPFLVITPVQAGITGAEGYGGEFESNAKFLGLAGGYALHTTPGFTTSSFVTYDLDGQWGLTGGITYNSWTGGSLPGSIRLPPYALVKAGVYAKFKGVRADFYVDNAFDRQYFIAEYDVDSNASVLPGVGREFHLKLSKRF
jgi:iron complex outermembrane recepter protein